MLALLVLAQSISLSEAQRTKLGQLVASDKEAAALFEPIKKHADGALKDDPNPIEKIETQGKLKSDPVKVRTHESLRDMKKIDALTWAFAVTREAKYAAKAKEFIGAWAKVNRPTGDPIDETQLEPIIVACDLVGHDAAAEAWLRKLAHAEMSAGKKGKANNWQSHRLKIVGLIGFLLKDKELIDFAVDGYHKHIEKNLHPDGSSFDFQERDALHYHCYDLEPLLALAVAAKMNAIDVYGVKAESGASLAKSVHFLVPYCDGTKTHAEFVNSKVAFDKKRADAGEERYKAGRLFDPKEAGDVLEPASAFELSLLALLAKVMGTGQAKYPAWQTVLNEVRRQ